MLSRVEAITSDALASYRRFWSQNSLKVDEETRGICDVFIRVNLQEAFLHR